MEKQGTTGMPGGRRREWALGIAAFAAAVLVLTACGSSKSTSSSGDEATPKDITLLMPTAVPVVPQANWALGYTKGWYEKYGVNVIVQFTPTNGSSTALQLLAAGQGDVYIGDPIVLAPAIAQGADLVAVYQQQYQPTFGLAFPSDSKYQSIQSLSSGKPNIGVNAVTGTAPQLVSYALSSVGVSSKDVNLVPIGSGPAAITAVKAGRVDAAIVAYSDVASYTANGVKLNMVELPNLQDNYPGTAVITTKKELKSNRDAIVKFLKGFAQTQSYCVIASHAQDCAGAYATWSKSTTPIDALTAAVGAAFALAKLPDDAKGQYGYFDAKQWVTLEAVVKAANPGLTLPEPASLYDKSLLKDVNKGLTTYQ